MKKHLVSVMICLQILGSVQADETLKLSQEDAKQLHAFLLAGELLDFGDRTRSASAYLMAAELMLDYPAGPISKAKVLELCEQARLLITGDEFLLSWVDRLELRVVKSPRGLDSGFLETRGVLEAGEFEILSGQYDAGWVDAVGVEIRIIDQDGVILRKGSEVFTDGLAAGSYRWCVINIHDDAVEYRLLRRED